MKTVGGQWAAIGKEFAEAIEAQKKLIAEKGSDHSDEYERGWLHAYELGFEVARQKHRETRFVLTPPSKSNDYWMMNLLCILKEGVEEHYPADTCFRSGIMDALDNWMVSLLDEITA